MGALTARQVERLTEPGRCTDGNGLTLVVDKKGRRHRRLRLLPDGKRRDLSPGPARTVSQRQAREAASNPRLLIRQGVDPVAQPRTAALSGMTFPDAARAVPWPDWPSGSQLARAEDDKTRKAHGRDGQLAPGREMMDAWADVLAGGVRMPRYQRRPAAASGQAPHTGLASNGKPRNSHPPT